MKEIALANGGFTFVSDEDFEYLNQFKWYKRKIRNTFYAIRRTSSAGYKKRFIFLMHREIMCVTENKIKVDHADRDGLNNQRNNLRLATDSQSMANRASFNGSSSKYLGVQWHKMGKKWQAGICKNRKQIYLGLFDNEIDAALAYNKAASELHGEFASLNKI